MSKKLVPIFKAELKNGKLIFGNRNKFLGYISSLKDGAVEIVVRSFRKKRSHNQNNFYWMYLNLIGEETGDNPTDLHEYFKRRHLIPKFIKVLGKSEMKIPRSTTELSTGEFGEYMDKIEQESGIPIPDINVMMENFEEDK